MEQNSPTRRQGISAALATAQAQSVSASARFSVEDAGRSLTEMAQRDLDAALQLLADRAQYITGASGAAIALRRNGRDDMLCRATVGATAPELGALLSTEFGLSGESVRTRQLMRCDDAERDARVNREVCRQMGIASVLVLPVINDDQVLGVFELFSGKANAFGERDLSAVQRLSGMVETAVRMAHATDNLAEHLSAREAEVAEEVHPQVFEGQFLADLVVEGEKGNGNAPASAKAPQIVASTSSPAPKPPPANPAQKVVSPAAQAEAPAVAVAEPVPAKKPLFWSADIGEDEARQKSNADQSHVPPVLRGLSKCTACGFPVSAGRLLCVECEEKKWRGGPRRPVAGRKPPIAAVAVPVPNPGGPAFSAAAPSMAKTPEAPNPSTSEPALVPVESADAQDKTTPPEQASPDFGAKSADTLEPVLSAGIEPAGHWFANRYVVIGLLVIAAAAGAFYLLR